MKKIIFNASQPKVVDLDLSLNELLVLWWTKNIISSGACRSIRHDGEVYYWIKIDSLLEDYPILRLKKQSVVALLRRMVNKRLLKKTSRQTKSGEYGYYRPTIINDELFDIKTTIHDSHGTPP